MTGTPRRRQWSAEEKASIVSESLAPGAVVRRVALRHGVHPNQLHAWRRALSSVGVAGKLTGPPAFVPVATLSDAASGVAGSAVEIEIAGAVVRVAPGVDIDLLSAVLRAVRST